LKIQDLDSKYRSSAVWMLAVFLSISVIALIFYLIETDLPDETLFWLLSILRYSSFFVCICSVYLIIAGILKIICKPSLLSVLGVFMFILFAIYGACIIVIDTFIISISGGNG